jgi:hypothetical protein
MARTRQRSCTSGVGGTRRLVEQRHFAEHLTRAEHRERLFAHAGHFAADAHLAVEDEVKLVAGVAVLENLGAGRVRLLRRDLGDELEPLRFEPCEELDPGELFDTILHRGPHFSPIWASE